MNNVEWFHQKDTGKLISNNGFCLAVNSGLHLLLLRCNHQTDESVHWRWERSGGHLVHEFTKLCLDNSFSDFVRLTECRRGAPSQLFSFSVEVENL